MKFICNWIIYYLKNFQGAASITSLFCPRPTRTIFVDAGTIRISEEIWGVGAWCPETAEFISEPWNPIVCRESESKKLKKLSAPFLETYAMLAAILTLGGDCREILIYTDCNPAASIYGNRWCKTNNKLNSYIAYSDFVCTGRYLNVQVKAIPRERNFGAHYLSHGQRDQALRYATLRERVSMHRLQALYEDEQIL